MTPHTPHGGWKKWVMSAGALFLGLIQLKLYFVRELLVAELLLLIAFGVMGVLCGLCLLLGTFVERGRLLIKERSQAVVRAPIAAGLDPARPEPSH